MKGKLSHAPQARRLSANGFAQGWLPRPGRQRHLPQLGLRRGRQSVYLAVAMAAMLLTGNASPSLAEISDACVSEGGENAVLDAACCPRDLISAYWPGQSEELEQTVCQLLVFPTATRPNADEFNQRIVDGSLSSDSRAASADAMTLPSLWWNRDSLTSQLGGRRLVQSWISYQIKDSSTPVVDVMVNPQMWSVLTYNERFAVLNQFGTAARDFNYNLRFFQGNARNYRLVGLYACEFTSPPQPSLESLSATTASVNSCSANLDAAQIVQIQRNLLAAGEQPRPPASPPGQTVATDRNL